MAKKKLFWSQVTALTTIPPFLTMWAHVAMAPQKFTRLFIILKIYSAVWLLQIKKVKPALPTQSVALRKGVGEFLLFASAW